MASILKPRGGMLFLLVILPVLVHVGITGFAQSAQCSLACSCKTSLSQGCRKYTCSHKSFFFIFHLQTCFTRLGTRDTVSSPTMGSSPWIGAWEEMCSHSFHYLCFESNHLACSWHNHWSKRSACAALGCRQKRRWPLFKVHWSERSACAAFGSRQKRRWPLF